MPRTSTENRRVRDERRDQILHAALRVFARNDPAGTKIANIAAEAGISHGLVYHYFDSKDGIFTAIVEQALQGALWVTTAAREQSGTPWDHIVWLVDSMLGGARENPDYFLIIIQASTSGTAPHGARELMDSYGPRIFRNVVELIEEAQAAGQVVAGDSSKLAAALLACVQGLVIMIATGDEASAGLPEPELILRMLKP